MIKKTQKGLYCEVGNFYIDPKRAVENALITHAHSDHARAGHKKYLTHRNSVELIRNRVGVKYNIEGIEYGETISINGVKVSFHPAGHIIGSSLIKLEYKGQIWVITGDYKLENDGISGEFEPIKCTHLITETTFALPFYKWPDQNVVYSQINEWWRQNTQNGVTSILLCYAIGKAQRLLFNIDHSIGNIYVDWNIYNINEALNRSKIEFIKPAYINDPNKVKGSLIIATHSIKRKPELLETLLPYNIAEVSGWMLLRKNQNSGFVLSDHADWSGLNKAIEGFAPDFIYTTHGYTDVFAKWLNKLGYNATEIKNL